MNTSSIAYSHDMASDDPLARFHDGAFDRSSGKPMPLDATGISVRILGGLAVVRTERVFRNVEAEAIEATYTFPVPVHATLARLTARIGERHLVATARRRDTARADYESAIDAGKTAILHEEVMRGLHMLSVGQLAPGAEVAVASVWAMPLERIADGAALRVPTTIGDIYGRPPMADSDAPLMGRQPIEAQLTIACDSGTPHLDGRVLGHGTATVVLDRPIDITVTGWAPRALAGRVADGRSVQLDIAPSPDVEAALDVALLIDRSGSMASSVTASDGSETSTHEAVLRGLRGAAPSLAVGDRVEAWQFDSEVERVPAASGRLDAIADACDGPRGGTEIGKALEAVIASGPVRDILLVTDGQSYALDVQALARAGRRISVVLAGAGALDANVGHLAALTGGELFVVRGADAGAALAQALASLRRPHLPVPALDTMPQQIARCIGGMTVSATWSEAYGEAENDEDAHIVAAAAAALALPSLPEAEAAELALAHGIVCHLTSLVLVDEAGEVQAGLPAQRRVPLMMPASQMVWASRVDRFDASLLPDAPVSARLAPPAHFKLDAVFPSSFFDSTDWAGMARALLRGDTSVLPAAVLHEAMAVARLPEVIALAVALGRDALLVAIGLLARRDGDDRHATRVARKLLAAADPALLEAAARAALEWV